MSLLKSDIRVRVMNLNHKIDTKEGIVGVQQATLKLIGWITQTMVIECRKGFSLLPLFDSCNQLVFR